MKLPSLLFELGNLQVFTYQTQEEFMNNTYNEVFWQDRVSKNTYGPFKSLYDCMTHYTSIVAKQKKGLETLGKVEGDVIYLDFKTRKRVVYGEDV